METSELEIIKKIHEIFRTRNLRLSLAESCTAGLISHKITSLPGASDFFDSSIICYSAESKIKLLGVKKSILKKHGTISEEAARAMAEGIRMKTKTDFALSVTGNLGPNPIEDKKTGLLFMAVSFENGTESKGLIFDGAREEIKLAASMAALEFLHEVVSLWG